GSVPTESLFVLRTTSDGVCLERPRDASRRTRVGIYRGLGASVGLQLVSSVVVFVEGEEADSDKRVLDRQVGAQRWLAKRKRPRRLAEAVHIGHADSRRGPGEQSAGDAGHQRLPVRQLAVHLDKQQLPIGVRVAGERIAKPL